MTVRTETLPNPVAIAELSALGVFLPALRQDGIGQALALLGLMARDHDSLLLSLYFWRP